MATQHMLTTVDNPYDPFTQWDSWYQYDQAHGYDTPGLLARIAMTSDDLSVNDQEQALEVAIDEIVKENVLGIHKKVSDSSKILLNSEN